MTQDFAHLVRGDGINAAPEGSELHQLKLVMGCHNLGSPVQPGREGPLIDNAHGDLVFLLIVEACNAVFRQDCCP